jgi:RecA-family ATPase
MVDLSLYYDPSQIDLDDLENDGGLYDNIVEFPPPPKSDARRSNLEVALHYADAGAYVFAARSSNIKTLDKRPMFVRSWTEESTRDHATIKRFFNDSTALVAVDCGKSRVVVIDADRHGGPDGVAALKKIVGDDLTALGCPIVETAGGGLHLVFSQPFDGKPFGNGEGALKGRGINVRGAGGYVIGLGSVRHDGRNYRQMAGTPDLFEALANGALPQVPEALADLIRAPNQTREERPEPVGSRQTSTPSASSSAHDDERIRAWKNATFAGIDSDFANIVEGGRNNHLAQVAAYRYGRYSASGFISKAEAWDRCKDACQRNGLIRDDGPDQCRKSFESGFAAGFRDPHPGPGENEDSPDDQDALRRGDAIVEALSSRANRVRETIIVDGDEIDPETGEVLREAPSAEDEHHADAQANDAHAESGAQTGQKQRGPRVELHTVNAASLAGKPVPKQNWLVEDMIPSNNVTLLSGDGGTGKSLLSLQLAAAVATGGTWIGFRPQSGPAVFLSAEDEIDELHRRLARIEPKLDRLSALIIIPLAGEDAILAAPQGRDRLIQPTALFKAVQHVIATHKPTLLVLDTAADLYAGNENARAEVRAFISQLRGVCLKQHVAIVLLSHPSQNGLASGSGDSGSTSWNNSVRSRIYFSRRIIDRIEDDPDLRVLEQKKSNRGRAGGQITVRWKHGCFVREAESAVSARDAAAKASHAFLALLALFASQDRIVSDRPGPNFAPAIFSKHPDADGTTKAQFGKAMERLFRDGMIAIEEVGPLSRRQRRIVIAANGPRTSQADIDDGNESEERGADDG